MSAPEAGFTYLLSAPTGIEVKVVMTRPCITTPLSKTTIKEATVVEVVPVPAIVSAGVVLDKRYLLNHLDLAMMVGMVMVINQANRFSTGATEQE